ncbi:MAG: DNA recombination protein RmuC [Sulfurospirillum sp.]|nr:MAG: DNA recombination protein RmuC [Sulfurospirillum sp.]
MYIDDGLLNALIGFFSAILLSGTIFGFIYRKKDLEYQRLYKIARNLKLKHRASEMEVDTLKERINHIGDLKSEFKNIADSILVDSSHKNAQHLRESIAPFYENIEDFNKQIKELYFSESKERHLLTHEIEELKKLNQRLSLEASNLTNALKHDSKIRGNWGEMILERVLESSGLLKGREYEREVELKDSDSSKYRLDVLIHLPTKKDVIIDSKLSLISYERYFNDESNKEEYFKDFLTSVKRHINDLSKKSYHELDGIKSLDFVLMFIPIEGAYMSLIQSHHEIFEYANSKNIIIVSPLTLMSVLRVINNGWRVDYQNKNAKLIAKKAQILNEKFRLFVDEMKKIDHSLKKAQSSYDDAFKKLSTGRGNLIQQSKELSSLQSSSPIENHESEDSSLSTL